MAYLITYESKEPIVPGRCVDCPQHFANTNPEPGEPATGCGLSGELIPDAWDTDERPWNKCPVKKQRKQDGAEIERLLCRKRLVI